MAEYGLSMADAMAMTDSQAAMLLRGWLRRKRFESRLLIGQLAEAMQPKRETGNLGSLAMMGFGIRGAT